MISWAGIESAQIAKQPLPVPPSRPVYNAGQLPNSQDNSSFNNNSMQTNKPANPNAGPYTGNGGYNDPTKNQPAPTLYNNNMNQLPAPTPVNSNGSDNLNNNGANNTNSSINKR